MTNGQVAQLQELKKCWNLKRSDKAFIRGWTEFSIPEDEMSTASKLWLRRLRHEYRHQIKAMKRNQA